MNLHSETSLVDYKMSILFFILILIIIDDENLCYNLDLSLNIRC
jgi:hypothetical protein